MKQKYNGSLIVMLVLLFAVVGVYFAYNYFYYNPKESTDAFIEVYQEFSQDEINSIVLNHSNYKVNIQPSNDDKLRIVYYQKTDNANSWSFVKKKFTLTLPEKVESYDSLLFHSEKNIDVIEIYIPQNGNCSIDIEAIDGQTTVKDVTLKQLIFKNGYGDFTATNCNIASLSLNINQSKVDIENCSCSNCTITVVAGEITISLPSELSDYQISAASSYGELLVNQQQVLSMDENGNVTVENKFENEKSNKKSQLTISSTRCNIYINSLLAEAEAKE